MATPARLSARPGQGGQAWHRPVLQRHEKLRGPGRRDSFNTTGSLTVSAWIRTSSFPSDDAAIVSKRDNTEHGFQLDTTVDRGPRTIGFKLSDANGNLFARYGATKLVTNTWYYVTGVYERSTARSTSTSTASSTTAALVGTVAGSQTSSSATCRLGSASDSRAPTTSPGRSTMCESMAQP